MSQKLTELKKQAAEIAEQIKKLEAESPEERIWRIIREQVGAASMCWEHVDRAGIFDSNRASVCVDEIMEAVNEYVSEAVSDESFMNNELTLVLKNQSARIAELQDRLIRRDIKLAEAKILVNNSVAVQKDLEMKIAERDARIDALEDALQDAGKTERRLLSDIEEKDARIAELEKQLAEKDEPVIKVPAEFDAVRSDRDALERAQAKFSDAVLTEEIEKETFKTLGRPAIEYLKEFPEPWRTAALKAVEERPVGPSEIVSNAADALAYSFDWADGTDKWFLLHAAMLNGTEWPSAELFID